jgi:peptidoglycan/xylan/chitin deacetylase (PgdA/CDA1 family)
MPPLSAPILMLHHVEPAPLAPPPLHPDSYLDRADFARFLDDLAARGYRTWTLAEAMARADEGEPLPRRSVVLTFDDGCRCFAQHAFPELQSRGMTATLFAVSGELGGSNRWDRATPAVPGATEREERLLDAGELRRLAGSGVEIGSHSRTHRDLTAVSAAELAAEVAGSRLDLEAALGIPVRTFCYPYGRLDEQARAVVAEAGYLAAVGIQAYPGARAGDPFALPRMIVNPGESRFERRLKVNGLYPLYSRLPRLGLLRALRRAPRKAGAA